MEKQAPFLLHSWGALFSLQELPLGTSLALGCPHVGEHLCLTDSNLKLPAKERKCLHLL